MKRSLLLFLATRDCASLLPTLELGDEAECDQGAQGGLTVSI